MRCAWMLSLSLLLTITCESDAGGRRSRRFQQQSWQHAASLVMVQYDAPAASAATSTATRSDDALDEVNATRAQRGLKPFVRDEQLTVAAREAAKQRAARLLAGHLESDFACLPDGASATAAGCAAWEPSWGWGACCTYDNYTYAGAAWVMGRDGRRYMHLFVR